MEHKLEVIYKDINELIPYINNTRTHSKEQIEQIKSSIKEFGMCTPVGTHNNTIVYGHARIQSMKELGFKEVPTLDLSHLTEAQKKAYIIADNKLALNAGWDEELLKLEIEALQDMNFNIDLLGFSDDELGDLLNSMEEVSEERPDADEVPEIEETPVIRPGDLIELGQDYQHRLLCGDSTNENDVKKLQIENLELSTVHCISDPPYGIAYNPGTEKYGMIKNDDTFLDYIGLAKKYTNGFFFMWTSYQVVDEWIKRIKKDFEKINNMIIWHKGGGGLGDCEKTLATDFEIALVCNRGNKIQSSRIGSVWHYQAERKKEFIEKQKKEQLKETLTEIVDGDVVWKVAKDNTSEYLHPTQKPVEVNEKALINFTKKGDVVLDLFLGSGGNMIACENLARRCYGMELDEKYAQVIVQRYVDYTSNPMIKINGIEVDWNEYKEGE